MATATLERVGQRVRHVLVGGVTGGRRLCTVVIRFLNGLHGGLVDRRGIRAVVSHGLVRLFNGSFVALGLVLVGREGGGAPRGSIVGRLLVGLSLTLLRLIHGRLVGLCRLGRRGCCRGGLAGCGNALGDGGGVDRGGLEGVGLTALFDAGLADLAQTQELPAREEQGEGNQREDAGGKECNDREGVGLLDLPGQRQRQVAGAARRRGESGTTRRNVFKVQAHGALTTGLLEPHVGGGELLHEVSGGRLGEGLRAGLNARLSPGLSRAGRRDARRADRIVRLGLQLRTVRLNANDLGVGGIADPALDVLRGTDTQRHGRARLRRRGDRHVILHDRQHIAARHDQIGRRDDRRDLMRRRPQHGHTEQPDEHAYESHNAHRRCRHVSLKEFHGCSSRPTPTLRAFFRLHFTCQPR